MTNSPVIGASVPRSRRAGRYVCAAVVSLLTFLVFLPALRNEFVIWDDDLYIINNLHIRSLDWEFVRWAFTEHLVNYWQPITWISHALDYAVWGLDPFGHHLIGILLHALNTFLVILLAVELIEKALSLRCGPAGEVGQGLFTGEQGGGSILVAAGATGLLFGLHPLHVESVAWASERKDLLSALFFLLSSIAYIRAFASPTYSAAPVGVWEAFTNRRYQWSLLFFALALASKPMAVMLPAVLLVLDWYPLRRIGTAKDVATVFLEKLPFFALSLVIASVTFIAQRELGAMTSLADIPLMDRILMALRTIVLYLRSMVLPLRLLPYYPDPSPISVQSAEYAGALFLVAAATVACVAVMRKHPFWLVAWAYYLMTLLPVLGIVKVGPVSVADRFTYLPSLGPFLLAGLGAAWLWARADAWEKNRLAMRGLLVLGACGIFLAMSSLTVRQISLWKDTETLWSAVIDKEPFRVPIAYFNRGLARGRAGHYDQALEDFTVALTLDPGYGEAYMNRGVSLGVLGRYHEAVDDLSSAIRLNPGSVQAYLNRAVGFESIGRFDRAIVDYTRVLHLNPRTARAYVLRGVLYQRTGRKDLAFLDYAKACDLGYEEGCEALATGDERRIP